MALIENRDFVSNLHYTESSRLNQIANGQNNGEVFLGTPDYLFYLSIIDSDATLSSQNFEIDSFFSSLDSNLIGQIKDKKFSEAVITVLSSSEATTKELESILISALEHQHPGKNIIEGECIDIKRCNKFVVNKMWTGGGSITYRYPENNTQRQIPIVKASEAKKFKKFYLNKMKTRITSVEYL